MMQKKCKQFRQLSQEERVEIYSFLREGLSYREIGERLSRHHTTIMREIVRNGIDIGWGNVVYKPIQAEKKYLIRRDAANKKHIKLNRDISLRTKIYQLFSDKAKGWGPDEILGRLKKEGWNVVSTATLYRYIHAHGISRTSLLHHRERGYRKRYSKETRGRLNDLPRIGERDSIIETRTSGYHREGDTVVSSSTGGIVTLVERRSRYLRMKKTIDFKAERVYGVMLYLLYNESIESLTTDNGKEFTKLKKLGNKLNIECYRTNPYASYEKGTNERTNGLIRRYLPKGCDMNQYSSEEIVKIENILNHKPRKVLDYHTPYEVYHNANLTYIK